MKLAAIDIGSNAARLLITDVIEYPDSKPEFIKTVLVRVPLRLGFDVFEKGEISTKKTEQLCKTIKAYRLLLDVYGIKHLKACATSAMRDATNAVQVLQRVKAETGITVKVISGEEEATLIYENHVADYMDNKESYLYIDVGGGSTELTFFSDGELVFKKSFNIGTIRLLKDQVKEADWNEMKDFLRQKTRGHHHVTAIGSGGNINKVFNLSKRKEGKPLDLDSLKAYHKDFSELTLAERMQQYRLREDRADVIVPALLIYINAMRWADAEEIYVPKIGLADGLIHTLYDEVGEKKHVTN
ncbi:MAG TPA: exopolyphosphatase [Chitinophagaceae bacterium]|nr:exopolyphosphatase [Bacteroidota bacterium]HBB57630.1 exopolyphosphatase [Chitinophagaceae bacterium]